MSNNEEFMKAIAQIAEEKGIKIEQVVETIAAAIAAAYRRDYGKRGQDIRAIFDPKTGQAKIYRVLTVVDPEAREQERLKAAGEQEGDEKQAHVNPEAECTLEEGRKHKPDASVGDELFFDVTPNDPHYGRIAAQTAKQVIIQRIREAERTAVYNDFRDKENEIVNGTIQRVENGNVFVDLGRTTGILFPSEQIPTEHYRMGQRIKAFVVKVELTPRGTDIILSRSHPGMLRKLFELEVPEIYSGVVEIKAAAREAGQRSKVAVISHQECVDAVGSCIGQRGTRIQTVISELSGEKIDIIQWDEDPVRFVANSLSPAKVVAVDIREDDRKAIVHVNEDQLSLAIGKRGQNVRLAAKLTNWRIDVVKTGETEVVEGSSEATDLEEGESVENDAAAPEGEKAGTEEQVSDQGGRESVGENSDTTKADDPEEKNPEQEKKE